jgi:hypothetical protein
MGVIWQVTGRRRSSQETVRENMVDHYSWYDFEDWARTVRHHPSTVPALWQQARAGTLAPWAASQAVPPNIN